MPSKTRQATDASVSGLPADWPGSEADRAVLSAGAGLLWQGSEAESVESFAGWAVAALAGALGADYVALAASAEGRWMTLAESSVTRRCRSICWPMFSTATPRWPMPAGWRRGWRLDRQGARCSSFMPRTLHLLHRWRPSGN